MIKRLFGTDGVRGRVNVYPMTPDTLMKLAQAAATYFLRGEHRHQVVMAKDTRLSGYMVEAALCAGFTSMGMNVIECGTLPTPAVSRLTRALRADMGVMISASHNPYEDNGIKFFDPHGEKLPDLIEDEIEELFHSDLTLCDPAHFGRLTRLHDAQGRYIEFVKNTFPRHLTLEGMRIVLDTANGAAFRVAPLVLTELGAEVICIGNTPNGTNINDGCGATSPKLLCEMVKVHHAALGIALDGDADRLLIVDENGVLIGGDYILALIATALQKTNQLRGSVVTTVMANLGMERYLNTLGIDIMRTPVGDRYVYEAMKRHDCHVGGEQSGHILLTDYATAGDGLLAALQVLKILVEEGKPASHIHSLFTPVPQLLKSVRVRDRHVLELEQVAAAIESAKKALGSDGFLVVRRSGTEPLIRIMAQGDNAAEIARITDDLATTIQGVTAL